MTNYMYEKMFLLLSVIFSYSGSCMVELKEQISFFSVEFLNKRLPQLSAALEVQKI